jgi:hypothetical protein
MTAVLEAPAAGAPAGTPAAAPAAGAPAPAAGTPATPAVPAVPESYTLKLPEKTLLDPKAPDRLTPILKDMKVTDNAVAQRVLDAVHGEASEVIKVYEQASAPGGTVHQAMVAGFAADALKHPEIGNGDALALERISLQAGLMLNQYGAEYAARLKETGEAVHPAFLLMMKRLYADLGERALVRGGASPAAGPNATLYPGGIPLDTAVATTGP